MIIKNKLSTILFAIGIGAMLSGNAQAVSTEKAIKARQGLMRIYAFNLNLVGDMAKGKSPYDSQTAQSSADNLLAAATMKNGAMWPEGSSNDNIEFEDMTNALPEIWTTYPEIGQRGANLIEAVENFVKVAGTGPDNMKKGLGEVGKACKGCHKDFRAETE